MLIIQWVFHLSTKKAEPFINIPKFYFYETKGGGGLFLDNKEGSCRDKMLIYIHVNMIFVYVHSSGAFLADLPLL